MHTDWAVISALVYPAGTEKLRVLITPKVVVVVYAPALVERTAGETIALVAALAAVVAAPADVVAAPADVVAALADVVAALDAVVAAAADVVAALDAVVADAADAVAAANAWEPA